MEWQKITSVLDIKFENVRRFITKKWIKVHDQSGSAEDRYKPGKQIGFKVSMLRSNLCDYYRDEANSGAEGNINYSTEDSKCFDYKTKITQRLEAAIQKKKLKLLYQLFKQFLENIRYTIN